jgi:Cof subfamily protein (haloacid dehalogenase superfamily)
MNSLPVQGIILDLDGTLLSNKKEILPYTKQILHTLENQGIKLVFATGRTLKSTLEYIGFFSSKTPLVLANGALLVNPITKEVLTNHILGKDIVSCLYQQTRNTSLRLHLYTYNRVFLDMSDAPKYKSLDPYTYDNCLPLESSSLDPSQVIKAMITGDETDTLGWTIVNTISASFPETIYPVASYTKHIEIMNILANKLNGIKKVSEMINCPLSQMLAFGDADNDIEVLKAVKTGIAMENASPRLKAIAKAITDDNDHDGIGKYLASFFQFQ